MEPTAFVTVTNSPGVRVEHDVARAVMDALGRSEHVDQPQAEDFETLLAVIAQATQVINHLEIFRELAIAKADASDPTADRRRIGIAAAMPPSRLYRILDRHGRPRKRDFDAYDSKTQRMLAGLRKGHIVEGWYRGQSYKGSYIGQHTQEDGMVWLLVMDLSTQEQIQVPVTSVKSYQ